MAELELGTLERVPIQDIFPREDRHFTPWLANHLDVLKEIGLNLELVRPEVGLGTWGRVDILAKQAVSGAPVVIENQYGNSDDSHFLRLLGYATGQGADILVWVAPRFTESHRRILEWLNREDSIQFYAVEVSGWRIGDAKAPFFRAVVAPPESQPSSGHTTVRKTWNSSTAYADFYGPLVDRLRTQAGIYPVGRGGWRGRYRSFRTGYEDQGIVYYLSLDKTDAGQDGAWVGLQTYGEHPTALYDRMYACRTEIQDRMGGAEIRCSPPSDASGGRAWFDVSQVAPTLTELENDPGPSREWMFQTLVSFREAVQSHLERVMGELQPSEAPSDDEPLNGEGAEEE